MSKNTFSIISAFIICCLSGGALAAPPTAEVADVDSPNYRDPNIASFRNDLPDAPNEASAKMWTGFMFADPATGGLVLLESGTISNRTLRGGVRVNPTRTTRSAQVVHKVYNVPEPLSSLFSFYLHKT